jgi:hypothetical protein
VGAQDLFSGQLVQALAEALAEPAAVHEDQRRAVGEHVRQQLALDRRPEAERRARLRHRTRHVGARDADLEIEGRPGAGVDHRHRSIAAQEARDLGEGLRGRGEAVALDVVYEGLQRRDVEHAHAGALARLSDQPVDAPQEGRQRLAAAGGRQQQRVLPGRDVPPAALLHGGRALEALVEPAARGRTEGVHAGV